MADREKALLKLVEYLEENIKAYDAQEVIDDFVILDYYIDDEENAIFVEGGISEEDGNVSPNSVNTRKFMLDDNTTEPDLRDAFRYYHLSFENYFD